MTLAEYVESYCRASTPTDRSELWDALQMGRREMIAAIGYRSVVDQVRLEIDVMLFGEQVAR